MRLFEAIMDANHRALAGVYWTEDAIIEAAAGAKPPTDPEDLAAENNWLQAEIERLKRIG